MHYGEWPSQFLDHVNGDPTDNRIANLREVTNQENCKNKSINRNNKSGVIGVFFYDHGGYQYWVAYIRAEGRHIGLGYFKRYEDAVAARKQAEIDYGYHHNHGRKRRAA